MFEMARCPAYLLLTVLLGATWACKGPDIVQPLSKEGKTMAVIETSMGTMVAELFTRDAPGTCENFVRLVEKGYYRKKIFYRVVKGHVIQAGGEGKDTVGYTIKAEINPHKHVIGAVGMARAQELDSASTEFYICHAERPHLDGKYTVFGQVIEGLDVLEKIGNTEVKETFIGPVAFHRPVEPVVIYKITIEKR